MKTRCAARSGVVHVGLYGRCAGIPRSTGTGIGTFGKALLAIAISAEGSQSDRKTEWALALSREAKWEWRRGVEREALEHPKSFLRLQAFTPAQPARKVARK